MNSSRYTDVPTVGRPTARIGRGHDSARVVTALNNTALGGLGSGSTIGLDGAPYVTNGNSGTLVRIDPTNSQRSIST